MSVKNFSNPVVNKPRDLTACSAVPQPTAPPRPWQLNRNYSGLLSSHLLCVSRNPYVSAVCVLVCVWDVASGILHGLTPEPIVIIISSFDLLESYTKFAVYCFNDHKICSLRSVVSTLRS